ncbi:MAG: hypothetical protein R2706_03245 [Acidimicrobiales bacterium]
MVRISDHPNNRLRRGDAASLAPRLQWAPTVAAAGGRFGADYLIVERRPGAPLSRWWPDLTMAQRHEAIRQLMSAVRTIHSTQAPRALLASRTAPTF